MPDTMTPASIGQQLTARKQHQQAGARARYDQQRRRAARKAGYSGPLTRDEATVITLAALNTAGHR